MKYVFVDGRPLCQHSPAVNVLVSAITERYGTLNNSPLPAPVCGHVKEEDAWQIVGALKLLGFRAGTVEDGKTHAGCVPEAPR